MHSPDGATAHIRLNGPATHLSTLDMLRASACHQSLITVIWHIDTCCGLDQGIPLTGHWLLPILAYGTCCQFSCVWWINTLGVWQSHFCLINAATWSGNFSSGGWAYSTASQSYLSVCVCVLTKGLPELELWL